MAEIPGLKNTLFVGKEAEGPDEEKGVLTLFVSSSSITLRYLMGAIEELDKKGVKRIYFGAGGCRRLPWLFYEFNGPENAIKLMELLKKLEWTVVCEIESDLPFAEHDRTDEQAMSIFENYGGKFYLFIPPAVYKNMVRIKTDLEDRTQYMEVNTDESEETLFDSNLYLGDAEYVASGSQEKEQTE